MKSLLACSLLLSTLSAPCAAQNRWKTQFVITKGKDTVAVERFTRDATTLSGEISQSVGIRTEYVINLKPNATVEHVEMARTGKQGQKSTASLDFADTLVKAIFAMGAQEEKISFGSQLKPAPFLAVSFALTEQMVRTFNPAPGKTVKAFAVRLGVGDTATVAITRFHPDSVSLVMADVELKVALAKNGDVIGGTHTAQAWGVTRTSLAR